MSSLTVKMRQNVKLLGTSLELKQNHVYRAVHAVNQPDWEAKRLVFVYPSNDVESADSVLCSLWYDCDVFQTRWCAIDSHAGIYAPSEFCKAYNSLLWDSVSRGEITAEDLEIVLSGPDNAEYWEAWDNVVMRAILIDVWPDNVPIAWAIHEDGDIFLVHELHNWEGETDA